MAFAFLFAGLLLLVSGVRGTQDDLFKLVRSDFTGPGNFINWAGAVILIGLVGYIRPLRPVSQAFLVLLIVVLLLTKGNPKMPQGGFFAQLFAQLKAGGSANLNPANPAFSAGFGNSTATLGFPQVVK